MYLRALFRGLELIINGDGDHLAHVHDRAIVLQELQGVHSKYFL